MDDSIKKPTRTKEEFDRQFLNLQTCPHCLEKYKNEAEYLFNHICPGVIEELINQKAILEKEEALRPDENYSADWFELWRRFKALDRKANASYCEARYKFYMKREEAKQSAGGSFFPWQDQKDIGG